MSRLTRISVANTFEMRPAVVNRPDRYHRGSMETDWQKQLLRPTEKSAVYLQKVEQGDPFRFVFDATASTSRTLQIIDCHGAPVLTIAQTSTWDIAGNVTDDDGSQLHSYLYKLADLSALDEDIYYVLLTVNYDSSNSDTFVSEPFWLRAEHEGTMLIENSNSINTKGVWFEQTPTRLPFRVEAYIGPMVAKSTAVAYEAQDEDLVQLSSTAYREWPLIIGETGEGICDWVLNKLNHILDNDRVYFDGKRYVKADGASFDQQEDGVLFATRITLREPVNSVGIEGGSGTIDLYTAPGVAYAVSRIIIGGLDIMGAFTSVSETGGIVLPDSTAETAFIAALNAALPDYELYGTIVKNGSTVQYQRAEGEDDLRGNAAVIHTYFFGFSFDASAGNSYTLAFALGISSCVVEWGDGTYTRLRPGTLNTFVTHVYASTTTTYSVKVWGDTTAFLMTGTSGVHGSTPIIPQGMRTLWLSGYTFTGNTFDFNAVAGAQSTLNTLWVINCGLTAANNFNLTLFPYLSSIDFSRNALPSSVVSAFMYDVWRNATNNGAGVLIPRGTFSIVNQTPSAVLNALGNTYKSRLTSPPFSWTVNN